jgi:hypothetical protein
MKLTVSLDDDVVHLLSRIRKRRKGTLKGIVNDALRRGLGLMAGSAPRRQGYQTRPVFLGKCLVPGLDNVADALSETEGPSAT